MVATEDSSGNDVSTWRIRARENMFNARDENHELYKQNFYL
jgi:hypothetical protein